jgi:para-nitrobenzyl esterase
MMHGGAYWTGDKDHSECTLLGEDLSKMGYVVISPQYRYEPNFVSLISEEKMVKAVARGNQDARAIIRYLYKDVRENGNPWGIDTNNIFIGGASAGALNALHAAYLDEEDELPQKWWDWINEVGGVEGNSGTPGYPTDVKGVISISGALARKESLNNESTPFLVVHDVGDIQVPFGSGQPYGIVTLPVVDGGGVLHEKAVELGIYNPILVIPGDGHTSYEEFNQRNHPIYDSVLLYTKTFMYNLYCDSRTISSVTSRKLDVLKVFPNPSIGQFNIEWPQSISTNTDQYQLHIMDMNGRIVRSFRPDQQLQSITLDVPSGQYEMILFSGNEPLARSSILIH